MMNMNEIQDRFGQLRQEGTEIRLFDRLDSTNSEAKRAALSEHPAHPVLFVADEQTAGRGRCGNAFDSAKGGAYFSLLLPVENIPASVPVTCMASVAVYRAIDSLFGIKTGIKWVNDLFLSGKKVCGILAEGVNATGDDRYVIVGIGINLSDREFPETLREIAGSLGVDASRRDELIASVVQTLFVLMRGGDWLGDYRARSIVLGRDVRFWDGASEAFGRAVGIDADGGLEVLLPSGGRVILRSGEIHLRTV